MLTRFAPSPTGRLHIGHAYAAFCAFGWARDNGADCLLRIEDIDQTRCRPEYTDAIFEDLSWLGFEWSPPVRIQSQHFSDYGCALMRLEEMGVVYRCFLSRKDINAELEDRSVDESPAGERPYPGPARPLSADEEGALLNNNTPFAWRLSLNRARDCLGEGWRELGFEETGDARAKGWTTAHPEWLGDVILARKDTPTSYHLSVCHDDAVQGITHIVRGDDLFFATHIHVLLQVLLDFPRPIYAHHKLMLSDNGRKFSKSDNSKTLASLREKGVSPVEILRPFQT